MITDKLLRVSENQAITADAVSTNTIDLSVARDVGEGKQLFMVFTVTEAFTNATSVALQVITSDNADLSSATVRESVTVALANLTAGKQYVLPIPPLVGSLGQRYLGANYDVTGTAPDAGKVTTDIVETIQDGKKFYASGFSVV